MHEIVQDSLAVRIIKAIRYTFGEGYLALHEPKFDANEWVYLKNCLDSNFVSSVGQYVDQFEQDLASYTGAKYAIAVVNGTAGLHISLKLVGVQTQDEVLIPTMTFVATANAVCYCGAVPHFIDVNSRTLGVDPIKLKDYLTFHTEIRNGLCVNKQTNRLIRAIVVMHTFGHPVDMESILAIANDFHLNVIEDAAEALGSTYFGSHAGTIGNLGVLSFNGNKIITTGGGGAVLTNDADLAKRAKHLTTTAKVPHQWKYWHDMIGYNYRMPNLNAALGCAQLEELPKLLKAKRVIYTRYKEAFDAIPDLGLMEEPDGCQSNYWLQTLILKNNDIKMRDQILLETNNAGIMTRPVWTLMHKMPQFSACPAMSLIEAEMLEQKIINIPSSLYDRIAIEQ